MLATVTRHIVDHSNIWMRQGRDRLRLPLEPHSQVHVSSTARIQHFDRYVAIQSYVARLENDGQSTPAKFRLNLIASKPTATGQIGIGFSQCALFLAVGESVGRILQRGIGNLEAIADISDGLDLGGVTRIGLDLRTQCSDTTVDATGCDDHRTTPNTAHDILTCQSAPRTLNEIL